MALLIAGELSGRWTVAVLAVSALATVPFGEHLRNRFSSEGFDRFVVTTIAVTVTALAIRRSPDQANCGVKSDGSSPESQPASPKSEAPSRPSSSLDFAAEPLPAIATPMPSSTMPM